MRLPGFLRMFDLADANQRLRAELASARETIGKLQKQRDHWCALHSRLSADSHAAQQFLFGEVDKANRSARRAASVAKRLIEQHEPGSDDAAAIDRILSKTPEGPCFDRLKAESGT